MRLGKGGQRRQAIDISCGGRTTKVHAPATSTFYSAQKTASCIERLVTGSPETLALGAFLHAGARARFEMTAPHYPARR